MNKEQFSPGEIIHDHFDGSAHCVECQGPCKLTGAARIATELVRWQFAQIARQKARNIVNGAFLDTMMVDTLQRAGVEIGRFMERTKRNETK